jgi:hypothetical protein
VAFRGHDAWRGTHACFCHIAKSQLIDDFDIRQAENDAKHKI